jgi:beta-galactosidase
MERIGFDRGWRFHLGEMPDAIWRGGIGDADWREVDLPHDWSIELERDPDEPSGSAGGYFPTGVGWYHKGLSVPEEWRGRSLIVEFEGVYMNAEVWLDEHFLGRHPYGYTGFSFDVTEHLEAGCDHVLRVLVDNASQPNSRWYSGSGIYRHVWLWLGSPVHIPPEGISVVTPEISATEAVVRVDTTVVARTGDRSQVTVRWRVVGPGGEPVGRAEQTATVPTAGSGNYRQELSVSRPELWSPDAPRLYRLETELRADGELVDTAVTTFGIRSLELDADRGFRLNGEAVELRGGCVHHDNGPLGAASFDRAEERKVELLKANGFNAVRCAHNPPAPAFLDACDRLGMLVIEEAFDCWRNGKNRADYHIAFDDWWRRDLDAMVIRDRNHPCVIFWSIGNEVVERGRPEGAELARVLADHVRAVDPTRPVTAGVNGGHGAWEWRQLDGFFAALDVCGYNYAASEYRRDRERVRGRIVYGSESMAGDAFEHWTSVCELDHVIGDFVWTALDYLGEAGIGRVHRDGDAGALCGDYPWHQANCGDLDLCGFKRPQSFYRDVLWGRGRPLHILVHPPGADQSTTAWGWPDVQASWTWPDWEGRRRPLRVDVYSACESVELFLDTESLGAIVPERFVATFEVPYRPGTLRATGSTGGVEVTSCELSTVGAARGLRLTSDRGEIGCDPDDLSFVTVEVVDAQGLVHPAAEHPISFTVEGAGMLAAVGNGDPRSAEPYVGNRRRAHRGRCLAVLRSRGERGELRLRAEADGLAAAETVVEVA